jgi:hypothetical protein
MRDLAGSTVKSLARTVFAALCDYGNIKREMWPPWAPDTTPDGYLAWPSVARLVQITDLSERSVQDALRELEQKKAVVCVYKSQGGAPRKGRPGKKALPARTSCYLITPHLAHRCSDERASEEPKEPRSDCTITPQVAPNNPAPPAPYNPAGPAPNSSSHHHQRERPKERLNSKPNEPNTTKENSALGVLLDDDDRRASERAPLGDPEDELRLRFKERFADASGAIVQMVIDGLSHDRQALKEFVAFDDAHTGAPASLVNPGGYYRNLVKEFQSAQRGRREAERKERIRKIERSMTQEEPPKRVCPLGVCNGNGEIHTSDHIGVCKCEAGRNLPTQVKELIERIQQGAA